ncbi:hypothetical protein OUZ56_018594 [Daphnia magna]|uniref:Uncharacterized protein n=1 Tax=Daphnia magna TaxID=35525 RepID=A0ABQ9Z9C1_9CRUS|nr:hypothetical protein OUZ56_018594 [Daphnia magna]
MIQILLDPSSPRKKKRQSDNESVESEEENNERLDSGIENQKIGQTGNVESEEEYDRRWDRGIGIQKIRQSDNESVQSEEENFEIWGGGKWWNRVQSYTDKVTLQNEEEDEEGRRKEMGKQEREGRKLYNETAQNEVYDEDGRSKGMEKQKEERRHPSIEAAEASKMAAAEAESYQITVKANRPFANRNGEVTRSKLAIENRGTIIHINYTEWN